MNMQRNIGENAMDDIRLQNEKNRYELIKMMAYAGSGHPGGSLSMLEIATALYYGGILKFDPANPNMPDRDRLIVSKGHASPTLYVILADLGFFPKENLKVFDKPDSMLPKHCNRFKTPGIEASTGALGQGFSMAIGMAMAERLDKEYSYKVFCVLGDGEAQSGEVWEAAMSAAHFKLDNLITILDNNGLQIDGKTNEIMSLGDIRAKWEAFGWEVLECSGHDLKDIISSLSELKGNANRNEKPKILIANTIKGNGISFMENEADWHSRAITKDEEAQAISEIVSASKELGDVTADSVYN